MVFFARIVMCGGCMSVCLSFILGLFSTQWSCNMKLTQSLDKKLDRAYTKMLRVVKNVTWSQCMTNEVLYAGLPRISTTTRKRCHRFSGHCWRSKNEDVSDLVLWEPKHGKRSVGRRAHTFVDLLEADTGVPRGCLLAVMDGRVGWRKKAGVRGGGGGWGVNWGRPSSSNCSIVWSEDRRN